MTEIVLTGIGVVSPIGIGRSAFLAALRQRRHGVAELTLCEPPAGCEHAAEVKDYDWKAHCLSKQTYLDRASQLALGASRLALADAGLAIPLPAEIETGFCLGTRWGCVESAERFYEPIAHGKAKTVSSLVFSHSYPNCPTSFVAIEMGLRGYSTSFAGSRLAGLWALRSACDALRLGAAERILVVAVDAIALAAIAHAEKRGELPDTRGQQPPAHMAADSPWRRVPGEAAVGYLWETAACAAQRQRPIFAKLISVAETRAAAEPLPPLGCGDCQAAEPLLALLALLDAAAEGEVVALALGQGSSALRVEMARGPAPLR